MDAKLKRYAAVRVERPTWPLAEATCSRALASQTAEWLGSHLVHRHQEKPTPKTTLHLLLLSMFLFGFYQAFGAASVPGFELDIDLDMIRLPTSTTEASHKLTLAFEPASGEWMLQYRDNPNRFAGTLNGLVIERPDYIGSNQWWIVSLPEDGYPIDLDQEQRLVWFVYCAKQYISQKEAKPILLPFGDARRDPYVHSALGKATEQLEVNLCPQKVEFLFNAETMAKGVKNLTWETETDYLRQREASFQAFLKGHQSGETIASLQVKRWTNSFGMGFPTEWEFNLNWFGKPAYRCLGKTIVIRKSQQKLSLPAIPKVLSFTDKRVRGLGYKLDSVNYLLTNAVVIPPIDNTLAVQQIKRLAPSGQFSVSQMESISSGNPIVVFFLMLFISLAFAFAFWLWTKNVKNKKG